MRSRTTRAVVAVVLAVVAMVVVVALRGRGPVVTATPGEPTGVPSSEPAPRAPDEPPQAPLTGVVAADPTSLAHPAVAVKVSDVPQAHPQVGVDRADLVFVERIGVSYTRLAAVFHSDVPETVGPVRSVRPMDAPLLGPLAPVFGNTMGADWVVRYVDAVGDLDDLGSLRVRGTGAYEVDGGRPAPDHVLAHPRVLLDLSKRTAPPGPYLVHAGDLEGSSAVTAGGPGTSVEISYGPQWSVVWTYDAGSGRYLRSQPWGPHVTADGTQVAADNVLVLEVVEASEDLAGNAPGSVPVVQLVDRTGRFVAYSGGHSVGGTWAKGGVNDPFDLRTDAGAELLLAPGNTWVEMRVAAG